MRNVQKNERGTERGRLLDSRSVTQGQLAEVGTAEPTQRLRMVMRSALPIAEAWLHEAYAMHAAGR